jgi:hypothetical protein
MFHTFALVGTWMLSECVVGVNDRLCVLMDEMGCPLMLCYAGIRCLCRSLST